MSDRPLLGILGGSGLYAMAGLEELAQQEIDTPFGPPSSPVITGALSGRRVAFLARHGLGHTLSPSEVNYRANIYALKALGVERVLSVSACGSLREDYAPGDIVVPDQLFDFTRKRETSFFEGGLVAHVGVGEPFCRDFSDQVFDALRASGASAHRGGTYLTIEGPRFSTGGESDVYRNWSMSIIGMTTSPEAFLAREAELCYAVMAHVTDYDVWHTSEEDVSVEIVMRRLNENLATVQAAIRRLVADLDERRDCDCPDALASALITDPRHIPGGTRQKLSLLVDKYLDK